VSGSNLLYGGGFFGEHFTDALDFCAYALELFLYVFVAAVDVVDAVDDGFAISYERGQN
jgi:hypothetical protein